MVVPADRSSVNTVPGEATTILFRQFLALALASSLAAHPSALPAAPLALVAHADRAHIGDAGASAGTTVYDGDRLSTEARGSLRITSPSLSLHLDPQTTLTLHQPAIPHPAATTIDLASGTLIFSTTPTASLAVLADGAVLRPASGSLTMATIKIISGRELHVFAQRGALEFSYRCETEVVEEGKSYGVLLDPSDTEIAYASRLNPDQDRKKHGKHRPVFLFIMIGAVVGAGIPILVRELESPDSPSRPR